MVNCKKNQELNEFHKTSDALSNRAMPWTTQPESLLLAEGWARRSPEVPSKLNFTIIFLKQIFGLCWVFCFEIVYIFPGIFTHRYQALPVLHVFFFSLISRFLMLPCMLFPAPKNGSHFHF